MHRDQKIGLSLAVLIVGFTTAFCFRNEPLRDVQPLALAQTQALDARIEQLPMRAYTQREGVGSVPVQSELLSPVNEIVDSSIVDRPAVPMEDGTTPAGDVVELFAGPPEPMSSLEFVPNPLLSSIKLSTETCTIEPPSQSTKSLFSSAVPPKITQDEPTKDSSTDILTEESASTMRSYLVKSGDTLSGVSHQVYGTTRRYLEIYRANRDVLRDPNDLPVGTTLRIP